MVVDFGNDPVINTWLAYQSTMAKSVRTALICFIVVHGFTTDVASIDTISPEMYGTASVKRKRRRRKKLQSPDETIVEDKKFAKDEQQDNEENKTEKVVTQDSDKSKNEKVDSKKENETKKVEDMPQSKTTDDVDTLIGDMS